MGLSTVHAIAQAHRGGVHVRSEVGRGSTFDVFLPAMVRRAEDAGAKLASLSPRGTETILVAEDHEEVRRILVRVLERAGYRVLAASDGWEAIRLYSENIDQVRLVVMDVAMPHLGGREASERIRMLDPSAAILFASGSGERSVRAAAEHPEGGAPNELTPLLEKPYEPERLLRTIRSMLDGEDVV
jgi:CheY-like chemotaxis protein